MDENKKQEVKDWSNAEKWLAELVEHARSNARRWFIAFIVTLFALIATNAYWIYTMNSYEYVYQDGSGQNNFNKDVDGDINNVTIGEDEEKGKE